MRLFILSLVLLCALDRPAQAVVYGSDDRVEVSADPRADNASSAVAALLSPVHFTENPDQTLKLDFMPLAESLSICPSERFSHQPAIPITCTGFLIAPDLLVTAGHCAVNFGEVKNQATPHCTDFRWLFDFKTGEAGRVETSRVDPATVVKCKTVEYAIFDFDLDPRTHEVSAIRNDFALLRLDRPVDGRQALSFAAKSPAVGTKLSMLGHPLGLPMKSTPGGRVLGVASPYYLESDLDAFGGNSGSPVSDESGAVVGILVRSYPAEDLIENETRQCRVSNRCDAARGNCLKPSYPDVPAAHIQRIEPILEKLRSIEPERSVSR